MLHFLKVLGMNTADCYTHSTNVHHQTVISVNTNDVAFQSRHLTCGDTEENTVASIIMIRVEKEADALRRGLRDTHE